MEIANYQGYLLTGSDVKRTFENNYLKMLFEKHKQLPKEDIIDFLHKCQQTGANPMLNQVFLIERNTQVNGQWKKVGTVVFSYNFIQSIANQTGDYEGYTQETKVMDKFDIKSMKEIKMLGCKTIVKRKGREFPYTAWFDEYVQTDKSGNPTKTWAEKPYMMIEKCSLSGALRRAFPEALSGMYCEEEMESISNELEKQDNNSAIETIAKKEVERIDEVISRIETKKEMAEDVELITNKVIAIKEFLSKITEGKSANDKAQAMKFLCGVNKFQDLHLKTNSELDLVLDKIHEFLKEKETRSIIMDINKALE